MKHLEFFVRLFLAGETTFVIWFIFIVPFANYLARKLGVKERIKT